MNPIKNSSFSLQENDDELVLHHHHHPTSNSNNELNSNDDLKNPNEDLSLLTNPSLSLIEIEEDKIKLVDLLKTWYIISSTLPLWITKKNITITYSLLKNHQSFPILNDLVEYHPKLNCKADKKKKTIKGIDKPIIKNGLQEWRWHGNGWLKVFKSNWKILSYGRDLHSTSTNHKNEVRIEWMIIYFSKTLFTPNGIDLYCNQSIGFSDALKQKLITELRKSEDEEISRLSDQLFDIHHDS